MNMRLSRGFWLLLVLAPVARAGPLTASEDKNLLTVRRGERTVLVYQTTPNKFKAYVKELYTPAGVQVLLDSPHDHIHHHALMYAVKAEMTDFWSEGIANVSGTQRPRKGATRCTIAKDGGQATVEQTLDWVSAAGEVVLGEHRNVVVHGGAPGVTLLTWQTRLSAARARLWGAHYNGLGMRFVRSMDKSGTFFNPTGKAGPIVRGDEHNLLAPWCAYTAAADGKPVTVAMFGHPKNFRGQTMWFTMTGPFSYLAATLDLHHRRHVLRADRPIDVVYGVAVWDGRIDAAAVEKVYRQWLTATPVPVPKNADDWSATHVNVARPKFGTKAIASSQFGPDYGPRKAIDGKWAARPTDKWNSAANVTPHFVRLDLGQVRTIDRVRIYHEGIMPDGDKPTTSDFRVQHSQRQWGPWVDLVKPVRGNRAGITEHVFKPTRTRYVRLLIETGEQNEGNAYGRIFELEVYSPKQTVDAPAASTQPKEPTS